LNIIHVSNIWSKIVGAYSRPEIFIMSKALGIDFGTVRVGIAITDSARIIASPLETVAASEALARIKFLIERENIIDVIVGEAKFLNGDISEITLLQQAFVDKLLLQNKGIQIHRMNEMYTSKLASQSLLTSGAKRSVRRDKGNLDKISAAILLQSWLDYRSF
jgi:putative Holliday junction resolvase